MRRLIRALTGLVLLVALLAGLPAGLLVAGSAAVGPDFLPRITADPAQLGQAFLDRGSVELLLALMVLVGLVAWAVFALAVLVELGALLARTRTPRITGIGWAQGLAAALLGLIVLASPTSQTTAAAATVTDAPAPPAASLSLTSDQLTGPTGTTMTVGGLPTVDTALAPQQAPSPTGPTVTTARGDSLWALAQTHLGSGMRWAEIVTLNQDRPQPDGSFLTASDTTLPVGWTLELPDDAMNLPAPPAPTAAGTTGVTVAPGDTLSGLAQEYLGDATRAGDLAAASAGITQPDGSRLTDPDLLRPGWTVAVPTTATDPAPAAPSTEPPAVVPPTPAPSPAPAPPVADQTPPQQPPPAPPAVTTTPAPAAATPSPVPAPVAAAPSPTAATTTASSWTSLSPYTEFGGLLAAGVLVALGARRTVQSRRRRPGNRLVGSESVSTMELALRATEDPPTVAVLDAALRTWAARSGGEDLPDLLGAVIGSRLTLLLAAPATPTDPFLPGPTDTQWVLDPAAVLDTDRDVVAPFPTLVTLGQSPDGELVLLDLERAGAMTLAGDPDDVVDVLSAMAIELALSGWADHLDVTVVGLSRDLVTYLGGGRLRHADTLDDVLDRLERHHRDATDALAESPAATAVGARVTGVAEDVWTPEVVLTAHPVTVEQRDRLAQVAASGAGLNLAAVITAADGDVAALPGPWQVHVPDQGPTEVPVLGTPVSLQRLALADRDALLADFRATDSDAQVPGPDADLIPPEPTEVVGPPPTPTDPDLAAETGATTPGDHPTDLEPAAGEVGPSDADRAELATLLRVDPGAPEVRVLGPVEVAGPAPLTSAGASKVVELAVFLALNPGRGAVEVSRELGPEGEPWKDGTRQSRMSQLRTWLGADTAGNDYVPSITTARGYRLSEVVRTDWRRFQTLATRGLHDPSGGLFWLDAALDLVRGVPFSNAPYGAYRFALVERQEMVNRIVDVAHAAAIGHLGGDLRKARHAVLRGLRADPVSELLYRDWWRIEYAAGDLAAVRAAARDLRRTLEDVEISQESEDLLVELLDPQVRAARRAAR